VSLVNCRGGVLEGGPNVFARELRVFGDNSVRAQAFGDQTDDRGNWNARTSDARHATHHEVISHHSLSYHEDSVTPVSSAMVTSCPAARSCPRSWCQ
jgi:hypothetical protein